MKIEKRTRTEEVRILIGMIVDDQTLSAISTKWTEEGLFKTKWANIVGKWCVDYSNIYSEAPRKHIEPIFATWADSYQDEKVVGLVDKLLAKASADYESSDDINSQYLIDEASTYFNRVGLEKFAERIEGNLDTGNVEAADKLANSYGRIELGSSSGVDAFSEDLIDEAFANVQEDIIKLPEGLGKFFRHMLTRDSFIAFQAPEKRGKSMWLLDMAWRAMSQGRKVAYFECGDMSRPQVLERIYTRIARVPWFIPEEEIRWPTGIELLDGKAVVDYTVKEFQKTITKRDVRRGMKKWKKRLKTKETRFKLSCHPTSSLSVRGMQDILDEWANSGWVPDVVVCDYADILAPPAGTADTRDQINATWKLLRGLSQRQHCLLITATQADAGAYSAEIMTETNFSEDKRKAGQVNGMIGINASQADKEQGIQRLNWLFRRRGRFNLARCCYVAGCYDLYHPSVKSIF